MPYNYHNAISTIDLVFPEDLNSQGQTQTQTQGVLPGKVSQDAQRRIDLTALVNAINKKVAELSAMEREYVD